MPHPTAKLHRCADGRERTLVQLAELAGCSANTMCFRLRMPGRTPDQAVAMGAAGNHQRGLTHTVADGRRVTLREAAAIAGCAVKAFRRRVESGYTVDEAIAMGATRLQQSPTRARRRWRMADGRELTAQELAALAGCSRTAMLYRLARHSPDESVAIGAVGKHGPAAKVAKPKPERVPKPPKQTRSSPPPKAARPPKPAPATRPYALTAPPPPSKAFAPEQAVIVPPDVKRTVAVTPRDMRYAVDVVMPTFGRIGQYFDNDSAIARAYGGDKS